MTDVWSPIKIGPLQLPHRLAMAPMTRSRAKPDGTPGDLAPEYYAQRATMGLLITKTPSRPKTGRVSEHAWDLHRRACRRMAQGD